MDYRAPEASVTTDEIAIEIEGEIESEERGGGQDHRTMAHEDLRGIIPMTPTRQAVTTEPGNEKIGTQTVGTIASGTEATDAEERTETDRHVENVNPSMIEGEEVEVEVEGRDATEMAYQIPTESVRGAQVLQRSGRNQHQISRTFPRSLSDGAG